jgi:hypothetical protein
VNEIRIVTTARSNITILEQSKQQRYNKNNRSTQKRVTSAMMKWMSTHNKIRRYPTVLYGTNGEALEYKGRSSKPYCLDKVYQQKSAATTSTNNTNNSEKTRFRLQKRLQQKR